MRRHARLQHQRERADPIDLKAGTEVGSATRRDEPSALVGRGQGAFPTPPQAAPTSDVGVRVRSLVHPRTQDGHFTGSLGVQRPMPQDVEAQAGQLGNQSEHRLAQPFAEQVLTLLKGEKLRGFDLGRPWRAGGLVRDLGGIEVGGARVWFTARCANMAQSPPEDLRWRSQNRSTSRDGLAQTGRQLAASDFVKNITKSNPLSIKFRHAWVGAKSPMPSRPPCGLTRSSWDDW